MSAFRLPAKTNLGLFSLVSVAALAFTGCISTHKTVYRDQERLRVEFENDKAGRMFYEALSRQCPAHERTESDTQISVPLVFKHKHRIVEGESSAFNQAVRRCDTNGDGRITEQEARIFSESVDK